ncbi:MAG: Npt1/Npt2 family nucleotide transporter [Myxococcota bacterium]
MNDKKNRKSPLDTFLQLFADVRPGEGFGVVVMTLTILMLMFSYYIIKTVREPLILDVEGGAELKSYSSGLQAIALVFALPVYNWLAATVNTKRLLFYVVGFFLLCIQGFFFALQASLPVGVIFFVWVGIFSLSTIGLFWSFANEVYTREAGERLFPVIGIGMTGGAFAGSFLAKELFGDDVSPAVVLQVAAGLLVAHGALYAFSLSRKEVRDALSPGSDEHAEEAADDAAAAEKPKGFRAAVEGFALVFDRPYLRLIALLILLLNLVNTTGEYILSSYVVDLANEAVANGEANSVGAFLGEFYGDFFFWVNVAGVTLQAFVASRIVKYLGIGGVIFALPMVSGAAYAMASFGVAFSVFRWAKTSENATDYSVMNTARAMLWLPTSREEKYVAKQTVDTFVVRLGDLLSAGLVFAGTTWFGLSPQGFALTNVALVVVWIGLGWLLYRSYQRLAEGKRDPASPATF